MQGLEEFATFISFQSSYSDLRIISVESEQQATAVKQRAQVHSIRQPQTQADPKEYKQAVHKSLAFQDKQIH
jgi:hypothetical protein